MAPIGISYTESGPKSPGMGAVPYWGGVEETQMKRALSAMLGIAALMAAAPAFAEGNLASNGTNLELNINTEELTFSQNEWQLETGKYYRINVTSDGNEEIAVVAPELWRNSWINQVVVNDLEVKLYGLYSLEFDAAGTFNVSFVPLRPGEYDIYVPGYEERGLKGKFIVK